MLSPQELSNLQLIRGRIVAGEQMPKEELANAIRLLRADRLTAASRSKSTKAKSGGKPKPPPQAAGTLLGGLGIKV